MYPPLCGDEGERCTPLAPSSNWASQSPKTICPESGGLGGIRRCVGTGGSVVPSCITLPLGVSIPQTVCPRLGGIRMYLPLCADGGSAVHHCTTLALGVPVPQNDVPHTRGNRVYPLLCRDGRGGVVDQCTTLPRSPFTQKRSAPHRGDSGVSAGVWRREGTLYPPAPSSHWVSLSPKTVCPTPGGLGCIRRCVATRGSVVPPYTIFPLGVPIP